MNFGTDAVNLTDNSAITDAAPGSSEGSVSSAGYAAPAGTSGWFLGSIGQYYLVAKNLGGNIDTGTNNTWSESGNKYWYISGSEANKNTLETFFSNGSSTWAPYNTMPWKASKYSCWYWTSSEFSAATGFDVNWSLDDNFLLVGGTAKSTSTTNSRGVRPVIAF